MAHYHISYIVYIITQDDLHLDNVIVIINIASCSSDHERSKFDHRVRSLYNLWFDGLRDGVHFPSALCTKFQASEALREE